MYKLGFTNRLGVALVCILVCGMCMSYHLSILSIRADYMGALACWTVCFTPLAAGIDIVLTAIVKKSEKENTGADGDGIRYRQLIKEQEEGGPTI